MVKAPGVDCQLALAGRGFELNLTLAVMAECLAAGIRGPRADSQVGSDSPYDPVGLWS